MTPHDMYLNINTNIVQACSYNGGKAPNQSTEALNPVLYVKHATDTPRTKLTRVIMDEVLLALADNPATFANNLRRLKPALRSVAYYTGNQPRRYWNWWPFAVDMLQHGYTKIDDMSEDALNRCLNAYVIPMLGEPAHSKFDYSAGQRKIVTRIADKLIDYLGEDAPLFDVWSWSAHYMVLGYQSFDDVPEDYIDILRVNFDIRPDDDEAEELEYLIRAELRPDEEERARIHRAIYDWQNGRYMTEDDPRIDDPWDKPLHWDEMETD